MLNSLCVARLEMFSTFTVRARSKESVPIPLDKPVLLPDTLLCDGLGWLKWELWARTQQKSRFQSLAPECGHLLRQGSP